MWHDVRFDKLPLVEALCQHSPGKPVRWTYIIWPLVLLDSGSTNDLRMDNTTELELSTITVLRTNNDPSPGCTIDVSSTDVSSGLNFENNLPRPSLHLGAPGTPSTAQTIGLTQHSGAVISREDLEEELRRRDNQINKLKDLFISHMEDHEKEQRRKDNQLSELMNRMAALEGNLLHMHNTTELTPSDTIVSSEVLGNNNDPACTIDVTLEINLADRNPPSVKITPWRAFNTLLVLGLGVYKSVGMYQGQTTGPTTVDWIGSLVWATIVYWVSLYEPLVNNDPDSKEFFVWIFCRDLSGIPPTFPTFLFFTVAVIPGLIKFMVLAIQSLEPQVSVLVFISLVLFPPVVWGFATFALWFYLLPKLGSLLAKWHQHIPPFFRILPFDSSDWMFLYEWWILVFLGLLLPAFTSLLKMLHRLLTRWRNGGHGHLPQGLGSPNSSDGQSV
ncbi:hypothetical protein B0H14DRAFT_3169407 [Mycena olivaceomarginata]|nr:hypothetical protein B0H14DRAFT_3169407 [Mycena olivaceomarginata]